MNIRDLFQLIHWPQFVLIFLIVFGGTIFLIKKRTYFYYDPGWITIFGLAIGVSLVEYLYLVEEQGEIIHAIYVITAYCFFILGIKLTSKIFIIKTPSHTQNYININKESNEIKKLKIIISFLQLLLIFLLIVRASTQGLAIFAIDPEMAKVETNTSGFGLITRIVGPAIVMSSAIGMLFYTLKLVNWKRLIFMLTPTILLLLSSGSKGALLSLAAGYAVALAYQKRVFQNFNIPKNGSTIASMIVFLLSYSLLVLLLRGSDEENPLLFAVTTLAVRFLAFGDALYYFFFNELYLSISSQPISYLWDYLIVPTFAVIRLLDYEPTLGLRISGEMFGMERGGPNPTMFVEAYVYFGFLFGLVYVFFIGVIFQYFRFNAFGAFKKFSAWNYLRFAILFSIASTVPVDMILVTSDVINSLFVLGITWLILQIYTLFSNSYRKFMPQDKFENRMAPNEIVIDRQTKS